MSSITRNPKHEELARLVSDKLQGAELRNFHMTHEDGGTLEQVFVVLWRRRRVRPDRVVLPNDMEWGTHRAVINYELGESALMWGHYFRGGNAVVDVYQNFAKRIAEEI